MSSDLEQKKNCKTLQDFNTFRATWFSDFHKKTAVFGCLTNALAPLHIALEGCSAAQNGSASLVDCNRKKIFFFFMNKILEK